MMSSIFLNSSPNIPHKHYENESPVKDLKNLKIVTNKNEGNTSSFKEPESAHHANNSYACNSALKCANNFNYYKMNSDSSYSTSISSDYNKNSPNIGINQSICPVTNSNSTSSINNQNHELPVINAYTNNITNLMSKNFSNSNPHISHDRKYNSNHHQFHAAYSNPHGFDNSNFVNISNEQNLNHSLIKRDTEIERLKMRISLLETQNANKNELPFTNRASYNMSIESDAKLRDLEYNTALLRMQFDLKSNNEAQIAKLESLLNQREFEIQELNNKFVRDFNGLERELSKCKKMLTDKEEDILIEKNKSANLIKEIETLKTTLKNREEYISNLKTEDEIKEMEQNRLELSNEIETLKSKVVTHEKKYLKSKGLIFDKQTEITKLIEENNALAMEKEKLQIEFNNYKSSTQEVGELMEKAAENSSLRANLEIAKKMAISLQDKIKLDNLNHKKEVGLLKEKIELENQIVQSLRIEIDNCTKKILKLENTLTNISNENQKILNENCDKNERINALEAIIDKDSLKLLHLLFGELNTCTSDLDSLVTVCSDLHKGNDISVTKLLGTTTTTKFIDMNDTNLLNSLVNKDYIIKKTDELKKLRKRLMEIRKFISDDYAEKIGSNISCIQQ